MVPTPVTLALSATLAANFVQCTSGDGGVSGGGSGGGGCNPFTLVDAYGNLYGVSSTGSGADVRTVPVTLAALAEPIPLFTQSGTPGSNYASGNGVANAGGGDVFGLSVSSQSSATGGGASAFTRTDCSPNVVLSLPHAARIALMWDASATGVAHARVLFRDATTSVTIAEGSVSSYSTPMSASGRSVTMLPAGEYRVTISASSQCIVQGSASAIASYSLNAYLGCAALADITDDGVINGMDLASLLAAWGPVPARHTCDLDQDGAVSGTDLAALLAGW